LHVLVDQDAHDDVLIPAEAAADADAVAFAQHPVRLGVLAVHLDLAAFTPTLGLRAGLVQTRHIEPRIDAHWRPSDEDFDFALGAEPGHEGLGFALAVLVLDELRELWTHLVERHRPRRLLLGHLDDVESELSLYHVAHGAGRELERHVVERTHHLPRLEG